MIIFEGEELILHHNKGETDYIIVSFMCMGAKDKAKEEYFLDTIVEKKNIACLGVTTKVYQYYIHPEMEDIISLCNEITKDYQKIIVVGLSMAGYACLKYSKRLKADFVFAMSPRCTLDQEICPLADFPKSVAMTMRTDQIKQSTLHKDDLGGKIYLAYDPKGPVSDYDVESADFICNLNPETIKIPMFFSGHIVILHLQGTDVFQSIINSIAYKEYQDVIQTVTYVRRHHIRNIINKIILLMKRYPYIIYKMLTSPSFTKIKNNHILLNDYKLLLKLCFYLGKKGYQQESSECLSSIMLLKIGNYNNLPKPYQQLPNNNPYPYLINFNGFHLVYNYQTKQITSSIILNDTSYCLPIQLYNQNGKCKLICIYCGSLFELQYQDKLSFSLNPLSDSDTTDHIKLSFSNNMIFIKTIDNKQYIGINPEGGFHSATQPLDWESFIAISMIRSRQPLQQNSVSFNLNDQ